jgi:hypothetical protein
VQLNGTLPPELANLSSILVIDLENNIGLHGELPSEYSKLAPTLQDL